MSKDKILWKHGEYRVEQHGSYILFFKTTVKKHSSWENICTDSLLKMERGFDYNDMVSQAVLIAYGHEPEPEPLWSREYKTFTDRCRF